MNYIPYMEFVLRTILQQIQRENTEQAVETFYAQLKAEADERRRLHPENYAMPPGWTPRLPAQTEWCPCCGQEVLTPSDTHHYTPITTAEGT